MAKICPACNAENSDQAATCANCGAALGELDAPEAALPANDTATDEALMPDNPSPAAAPTEPAAETTLLITPADHDESPGAVTPAVEAPAPNADAPAAEPPAADETTAPAAEQEAAVPAERNLTTAPLTPPGGHDVTTAPLDLGLGTAPLVLTPEAVPAGTTAASAPTTVLPAAEELLTPLPVGALIGGRFTVKSLILRSAGRNLYRVTARNQQRCENCSAVNPLDAKTCARCGKELAGKATNAGYVIIESFDADTLVPHPAVHERGLSHPHLLPLVAFFAYTPYGPERHYAVVEWRDGVQLSQLSLPQPVAEVLNWGTQISAALAYLHQQGVVSPGATPDNIFIHDENALLINLQTAQPAPEDADERARAFSADTTRLAATLYETLTGRFATVAGAGPLLDDSYPPEVTQLFEIALRPAKNAPTLTDAEWGAQLVAARQALEAALPGVKIRSGRISDVGRVRELNEDSLAVVECQVMQDSAAASLGVYVVADGMGGHQGGEVASAIAISTVTEALVQQFVAPQFSLDATPPQMDQIKGWMTQAVQQANGRIHQQRMTYRSDMGTTLVACVVAGPRVYVANVGDSRAYILQPSKNGAKPNFRQLTVDHSLVQRLVSTGQISEDEAKFHPYRNVIYNSLGEKPQVQVDLFAERVVPGTRVLICSDGLSTMLTDDFLAEILASRDDPQAACAELVKEANAAGGLDNITIVAIYLESV